MLTEIKLSVLCFGMCIPTDELKRAKQKIDENKKRENMIIIFATTFNSVGDLHSDIPVVGLEGDARARLEFVLSKLSDKRTSFERSGQKQPSMFTYAEMVGDELETWKPRKVLTS